MNDFKIDERIGAGLTFGQAINALKQGYKVAREGWNGDDMWLIMVPGVTNPQITANTPYGAALSEFGDVEEGMVTSVAIEAHIDMFTANGSMQPGWVASQADMLSEDWRIV